MPTYTAGSPNIQDTVWGRLNIMRARRDELRKHGPQALVCKNCGQQIADGDIINRQGTRNRGPKPGIPNPNWPGTQYWHLDCNCPSTLPGATQTTLAPAQTPYTLPSTQTETPTQADHHNLGAAENAPASAALTQDDKDALAADIVTTVVQAINDTLTAQTSQHGAAVSLLTDAIANLRTQNTTLTADLATLKDAVAHTQPIDMHIHNTDPNADYTAALPTLRHHNFPLLVRTAVTLHRDLPRQANIWLVGPAGTGKSTAGEQLAATLRYTTGPRKGEPLDFHYMGAISDPYQLLGYTDAHGHVVRTPFREGWEHGGVIMFDELDASSESATLAINGPLANGYCYFPVGPGQPAVKIMRHADVIAIGTANTNGMGADAKYVGRNRLDGAFLSRFPTKIEWAPDAKLERTLTNHDEWYAVCDAIRTACDGTGTDFLVTSRDMMTGATYLRAGFTRAEVVTLIFGSMQRQDADAWRTVGQAARAYVVREQTGTQDTPPVSAQTAT